MRWDQKRRDIAASLASGETMNEVALKFGLSRGYLQKLKVIPEFAAYMDELTMALGLAKRAERIRIAQRVVNEKIEQGGYYSKKDLLEWLKYVGEETGDLQAAGTTNITIQITQTMQQVPIAERPAALLNLARGFVQGLNTVPGINSTDPDITTCTDEPGDLAEEIDILNGGGNTDGSGT